jgi:hypothetical protein
MRSLCRILVVLPPLLLLSLALSPCCEPGPPLVSLDLRALGYLPPVAERDIRSLGFLDAPVAFLDDETLAVSFLVANEHPGLSKRDALLGSPILLRTVLLDPLNGHAYQQRSWGNAENWQTFLPLQNSHFFVRDAEHIGVYSKDLHEIASATIQLIGDLYPRFAVSPSGDTLFSFSDSYDSQNRLKARMVVMRVLLVPRSFLSQCWLLWTAVKLRRISTPQLPSIEFA